MDTALEGA
ncbi:hypothetical protein MADA3029_510038 [Vibrio nigripulchritudo MADA3029]|nr:hypothetical protein VIBNIMADA3020_750037 [Vibrio nigripulchritudo MADA3020]CCN51319.1 hypothetical protein VIBNIMADA3021_1040037 [Vibrio nigripulchritudo MADA3021]CCN59955.1 hypothetical protein MADA3029_510038 [Vibrio nigripulchritudo MADA3029]CCN81983.1 hypothetical protein VIBNIBLFn1_300075 [Vibrio nigripulchritudo BLFn1]CCN90445.1 hypothetical protein VIBNISFn27_710091 [Vibrio nigripulchritudo SFn27]CCN93780.1 hypothetical protein VIBNIENn2_310038 [Vibrio nigripulchritudo ENn2]CCO4280